MTQINRNYIAEARERSKALNCYAAIVTVAGGYTAILSSKTPVEKTRSINVSIQFFQGKLYLAGRGE